MKLLRRGCAVGVFDFCHEGHIRFLNRCRGTCTHLTVAVHTDAFTLSDKETYPANSEQERLKAVEDSGLADRVILEDDYAVILKKNRITHLFHGDDWNNSDYRTRIGNGLLSKLRVEIVFFPYTPGICSSTLRKDVPPIGFWLYKEHFDRSHIFDHLKPLYRKTGGTWFVAERSRSLIESVFPGAPKVILPVQVEDRYIQEELKKRRQKVWVTGHFNYEFLMKTLSSQAEKSTLITLSHGRSGKAGASASLRERLKRFVPGGKEMEEYIFTTGNVTVQDLSYSRSTYMHLDDFIVAGGRFTNPVPKTEKPRILLVSTWSVNLEQEGLLVSSRWYEAVKRLTGNADVFLSPHPLLSASEVGSFIEATGCGLLPPGARSFEAVKDMHCVVSDLSGGLWEALLFDTPVVLAEPLYSAVWPDDLKPSYDTFRAGVPVISPAELSETVLRLSGSRKPGQRQLAEDRLGIIDGKASERVAERIIGLLSAYE